MLRQVDYPIQCTDKTARKTGRAFRIVWLRVVRYPNHTDTAHATCEAQQKELQYRPPAHLQRLPGEKFIWPMEYDDVVLHQALPGELDRAELGIRNTGSEPIHER